ncbi:immunoglobulin domain-containing protein [Bacteroidota bacterium]
MAAYSWTGPNSFAASTQNPQVAASATVAMSGDYELTVTDGNGCVGAPVTTTATINALPVATASNDATCVDAVLNLTGGPAGMTSYSWTGPNGFTSSVRSPQVSASSTLAMDGVYSLTVTNSNGCASAAATTTVALDKNIVITTQPQAQQLCPGDELKLSVVVTGTSPTYSWRRGATEVGTTRELTINPVDASDEGNYQCIVSGTCVGETSSTVFVEIYEELAFDTDGEPADLDLCEGEAATFDVDVTGAVTSYQWIKDGSPVVDDGVITGQGTATLNISSVDADDHIGSYTCIITGPCGTINTSASLEVDESFSITGQPTGQDYCKTNDLALNVTVSPATGANVSYKWYKNGSEISGQTGSGISFPNADESVGGSYYCTVTNNCLSGIPSNTVSLTMNDSTEIVSQPSNEEICEGQTITIDDVVVDGDDLVYQWTFNTGAISDTGKYSDSDDISLQITNIDVSYAGSYALQITGACGSATSSSAIITVNEPIAITDQPDAVAVCPGGNPSFSVTATGTDPQYQWKFGITDVGSNQNSLGLTGVDENDQGNYTVTVSNMCNSVPSGTAALNVYDSLKITTQPISQSLCEGSTNVVFEILSNAASYQWRLDGSNLTEGVDGYSGVNTNRLTINSLVAATHPGEYTCFVAGLGNCSSQSSEKAVLVVDTEITINDQPDNQNYCEGNDVPLAIGTSSGSNLKYQWYKDIATILSGETTEDLLIIGADAADATDYYCKISNSCGPTNSTSATLTMDQAVAITTPLSNKTICVGSDATFTVVATGTSKLYAWTLNGNAISDTGKFSNTTKASMSITGADISYAGTYVCTVTGTCGTKTTSATLSVDEPIDITVDPTDQKRCPGSNISLSVEAEGTDPAYQWQFNGSPIADEDQDILYLNGIDDGDAGTYTCVVTGGGVCGSSVTSDEADLVVYKTIAVTSQPADVDACEGDLKTVSVTVSNTGSIKTYRWRRNGTPLSDNTTYSGSTGSILNIFNMTTSETGDYTCVVTGQCNSVTSEVANVVVDEPISITTDLSDQEFCDGDEVFMTIKADGTNITYAWYKDNVLIDGETEDDLVLSDVESDDAADYYCILDNNCSPQQSQIITLTRNETITKTSQSSDQELCEGGNLSLSVTTNVPAVSYEWIFNSSVIASDTGKFSGSDTRQLQIPSADNDYEGIYVCRVTGDCGSFTTDDINVTINVPITIDTQPTSKEACPGSSTSFTVKVSGTSPTYQWLKGTDIVGTSPTLSFASVTATDEGNYKCIISGAGSCSSVQSNTVSLDVLEEVVINEQPDAVSTCEGLTADFSVDASGSIVGYQWKRNGSDISGASLSDVSLSNLVNADGGSITVVIDGRCGDKETNAVQLVVDEAIVVNSAPTQNIQSCEGQNVILEIDADGTNLIYTWFKDGTAINNETDSDLVLANVTETNKGDYFCQIANSCEPPEITTLIKLSILDSVKVEIEPESKSACVGNDVSFSVVASGASSYKWTLNGTDLTEGTTYQGVETSNLLVNNITSAQGGAFVCEVSGSCGSVNTEPAILTVNELVVITVQPNSQAVCYGTNIQFQVTATGTDLSYQWIHNGTTLSSATNSTLVLSDLDAADAGTYVVTVSGACPSKTSNQAILTLRDTISIITPPSGLNICEDDNASFTVSVSGYQPSFQWKRNGVAVSDTGSFSGSASNTFGISSAGIDDEAVYSCEITNMCGSENTPPATLRIKEDIVITTHPVEYYAVEDKNASFSVVADGDVDSYQWYNDDGPILDTGLYSGATTSILTLTGVQQANAGDYYCILESNCSGTVISNGGRLFVNLTSLITEHPEDQGYKCIGVEVVTFDVVTDIALTNPTFQWKKNGQNLVEKTDTIEGVNTASLTIYDIGLDDEGNYTCFVTADQGLETSESAGLLVFESTEVSLQPTPDTRLCEGEDLLLVLEASGDSLVYTWKRGTTILNNGTRISGADSPILSISNVETTDDGVYTCAISGKCGPDNSSPADVTVDLQLQITKNPESDTICYKTPVSFTVQAVGASSYQWRKGNKDLENLGKISGAKSNTLQITGAEIDDAGTYSCFVSGNCGAESSLSATLVVKDSTVVNTSPVDKNRCQGDDVVFVIDADGSDLEYRWTRDGVNLTDFADSISGSTTDILILSDLMPDEAGTYQAFVSGYCGSDNGTAADLIVYESVKILTNPEDKSECVSRTATFSVLSSDPDNNTYQWKRNGKILVDSADIDGATTAHLAISGLTEDDEGVYSCTVKGTCDSLDTKLASLTVLPATMITGEPIDQEVAQGESASFSVVAEGYDLLYNWFKDNIPVTGNSNILTIDNPENDDEGAYQCLVTSSSGCGQDWSKAAQLQVNVPTQITVQPETQVECEGTNAIFTITATGDDVLNYQWYKNGTALQNISDTISGVSTNRLSIVKLNEGHEGAYSCIVSGPGDEVSSNIVNLVVDPTTRITNSLVAENTLCEGDEALFSIDATGEDLEYVWKRDTQVLSDDGTISGATTDLMKISGVVAEDAGNYSVEVDGKCGSIVFSNSSTLNVNINVGDIVAPSGKSACEGTNTTLSISVDNSSVFTYQWKKSGTAIPKDDSKYQGLNSLTMQIIGLEEADEGVYTCEVIGKCNSKNSDLAYLTVTPKTAVINELVDQTVDEGTPVTFTIDAVGEITSYLWFKDNTPISDAIDRIYTIDSPTEAAHEGAYYILVTGNCETDQSNLVNLFVNVETVIEQEPESLIKCEGDNAVFSIIASGETNLDYQWLKNGVEMINIDQEVSGVTSNQLTISDVEDDDDAAYTCVVTGNGGVETSKVVTLTVNPTTRITTQPVGTKVVCEAGETLFKVEADGVGLIYTWMIENEEITDTDRINGLGTNILTISDIDASDEGRYTVRVEGTCEDALSTTSTLSVNELVSILAHPEDTSRCVNQSITLKVAVSDSDNSSYQWKKNGAVLVDGVNNVDGALTETLTIEPLESVNGGVYSCEVTGLCNTESSNFASLKVLPITEITNQPDEQTVNEGEQVTFSIEAVGYNLSYQWYKDGTEIQGATNSTFIIDAAQNIVDEGTYNCIVTGESCGATDSDAVPLTVNLNTVIDIQPLNTSVCESDNAEFRVEVTAEGERYEWRKDGIALTDTDGKISGAESASLEVLSVTQDDEGSYACYIFADGGNTSTNVVRLNVNAPVVIIDHPKDEQELCEGENVFFSVNASGDSLTYQWLKDNVELSDAGRISGSNNEILTITDVISSDRGSYECEISGACPSLKSNPSTLVVNGLPETPGTIAGETQLCQGDEAEIYEIGALANATSYEWILPYGATIDENDNLRQVLVDYAIDALGGDITVRGVNSCGPGPESDPLSVTINNKPVSNAGNDQSLCNNFTSLLANEHTNGIWTRVAGNGTFDDNTAHNPTVTNISRGENKFVWTVTENICTTSDTVVVRNNRVIINAGLDTTLCDNRTTLIGNVPSSGTTSWNVIDAEGTIISPTQNETQVIGLRQGTNIFEWTANNNGCISRDTVEIINDLPDVADAGLDARISTDSHTISANDPGVGIGVWSLVSGGGDFLNELSATTQVTGLSRGDNIFNWTITKGACTSSDEVIITNCTPTIAYAGVNDTICGDSARLKADPPVFGVGKWTRTQGYGEFKDNLDYETDVLNVQEGENIFTWTITNKCETVSSSVVILNNSPTEAKAGTDQTICRDSTRLLANIPEIGTGSWSLAEGDADINDSIDSNTDILNLRQGTATFRWTITNQGCSSVDDVFITNDLPTTAEAGEYQETCEDEMQLSPNTPSIGVGEWTVIQGRADIEDNFATNLDTFNILRYTISNHKCSSYDDAIVISNKPTDAYVKASNVSICQDTFILTGNTPIVGEGSWQLLSGQVEFDDFTDPTTIASNIREGLNIVRWNISNNGCSSIATLRISYDYVEANAGEDEVICLDFTTLNANEPRAGIGEWTVIPGMGRATFDDRNIQNTGVEDLKKGENYLKWTIRNGSCISTDTVTILNNSPSDSDAGSDRLVCGEQTINLDANTPLIGVGTWEVLEGFAEILESNNPTSSVTNLRLGETKLRWTIINDDNTCESFDEIIIKNNKPPDVDAGRDQRDLCSATAKLSAEDVDGGIGRWSLTENSSGKFENNTAAITTIDGLQQGSNYLVWSIEVEGCTNSDTVVLVNNLPTEPNPGPNQSDCSDEFIMAANEPTVGRGYWTKTSATGTFKFDTSATTVVTGVGLGENIFTWNTQNDQCVLSESVILTNNNPSEADAGTDQNRCNTVASLLANEPLTGSGSWQISSGGGRIADMNSHSTQILDLPFGPTIIRWTTQNGECYDYDDVTITNDKAYVYAGMDTTVSEPSVQLNGNNPSAGTGTWISVAAGINVEFVDPNSYATVVNNLGQGANTFAWTIDYKGCIARDEVVITYQIRPQARFLPNPPSGCPPLTVEFINDSRDAISYTWDFNDPNNPDPSNKNDQSPLHVYTVPGVYTVTLRGEGSNGLVDEFDTTIIVREQPEAIMQVTPGEVYISLETDEENPTVNFFNLSTNFDSVLWEFGDGNTSTENNPRHIYSEIGVYDVTLHVETDYQCYDSETLFGAVNVLEKGSFICPNVFTPAEQSGGYVERESYENNVFHCFAEGLDESSYLLEIYNKLGIRIFSSNDINIGWDGYIQGTNNRAPEGVYIYQLSGVYNNGKDFDQVGSITIIYNDY